MHTRLLVILVGLLLAFVAMPAAADDSPPDIGPYDPYDVLEPTHAPDFDDVEFGTSVATDGTLVVVGAPNQDTVVPGVTIYNTGVLYVFQEQANGTSRASGWRSRKAATCASFSCGSREQVA